MVFVQSFKLPRLRKLPFGLADPVERGSLDKCLSGFGDEGLAMLRMRGSTAYGHASANTVTEHDEPA